MLSPSSVANHQSVFRRNPVKILITGHTYNYYFYLKDFFFFFPSETHNGIRVATHRQTKPEEKRLNNPLLRYAKRGAFLVEDRTNT